jgi:hypothetical protein
MAFRDLPVQVEAVNAFRDFAEALQDVGRLEEALSPILSELLGHLFHLATAVEAMDVIMSVDTIIRHLGDAIQPHAESVCREVRCAPGVRSSKCIVFCLPGHSEGLCVRCGLLFERCYFQSEFL